MVAMEFHPVKVPEALITADVAGTANMLCKE